MTYLLTILKYSLAVIVLITAAFILFTGFRLYRQRQNLEMATNFSSLLRKLFLIFGISGLLLAGIYYYANSKLSSRFFQSKELPYIEGDYFVTLESESLIARKIRIRDLYLALGKELSDEEMQKYLIGESAKIKVEQETVKKEINVLAPKAEIKKTYETLANSIFVSNLTETEADELKRRGYKVLRNFKIVPLTNGLTNFDLGGTTNTPLSKIGGNGGYTGAGVKIAIIDGGFEYFHSDFGCANQWPPVSLPPGRGPQITCRVGGGHDFADGDENPLYNGADGYWGHATHVASIAGGKIGIAPDAILFNYRVSGTEQSVCDAIDRAIDPNHDYNYADRADVINMSLGGYTATPESQLANMADAAVENGTVFVAATGNSMYGETQGLKSQIDGVQVAGVPAGLASIIGVGAIDSLDNLAHWKGQTATWSLGGPTAWKATDGLTRTLFKPDVVAPGVNVCGAKATIWNWNTLQNPYNYPTNGDCDATHATLSGTSMATPVVVGAAALIIQAHRDWTPAEVKAALRATADATVGDMPVRTIFERGFGRINVVKAIAIVGRPPIASIDAVPYDLAKGANLAVKGTAADKDTVAAKVFKEYRVYYGTGRNPSSFSGSKTFTAQVSKNTLFTVYGANCATPAPAEYLFRLEVEDRSGNVSKDYMLIKSSCPVSLGLTTDFSVTLAASPATASQAQVVNLTPTMTPSGSYVFSGQTCGTSGAVGYTGTNVFTCTYATAGTFTPKVTVSNGGFTHDAQTSVTVSAAGSCGSGASDYDSEEIKKWNNGTWPLCSAGTTVPTSLSAPTLAAPTTWICRAAGGDSGSCTATFSGSSCGTAAKAFNSTTINDWGTSALTYCKVSNAGYPLPSPPTKPTATVSSSWQCQGSTGGSPGLVTTCVATLSINEAGECGSAATSYSSSASSWPSNPEFCKKGTFSGTSQAFPAVGSSLSWVCNGVGTGGNSPTCTATHLSAGTSVCTCAPTPAVCSCKINASDSDGHSLRFELVGNNQGMTITGNTISKSAGLGSGNYDLKVKAIDAYGAVSAEHPFKVSVSGSTGVAPVINSTAVTTATIGQAYSYQVTATNNPTSFTRTVSNSAFNWLTMNTAGLFSVTVPGTMTAGATTDVTVSASNAYGTGTQTYALAIAASAGACSGTIFDGVNSYPIKQVGTQCWMAANMKVGNVLASGNMPTNNGIVEKWCYDGNNCNSDGGIYTYNEVIQSATESPGARGLCPIGWHVPTDDEWHILENYLTTSGNSCVASRSDSNPSPWQCSPFGTKMKADTTVGMMIPMAGWRNGGAGGSFYARGYSAYLWSSSNRYYRAFDLSGINSDKSARNQASSDIGFSVRCIKDTAAANQAPVINPVSCPTTGTVGTVYPGCTVTATDPENNPITFTMSSVPGLSINASSGVIGGTPTTPNSYTVTITATDSLGGVGTKNFSLVVSNSVAAVCDTPTVTDASGNIYNTVAVGNRCWMATNLKTKLYPNGTTITKGPASASWNSVDNGYYSLPPNTANSGEETQANVDANNLGYLYQRKAAMAGATTEKAQGVCPNGWHIPSKDEVDMSFVNTAIRFNQSGMRNDFGTFFSRGENDHIWTSTPSTVGGGYYYCRLIWPDYLTNYRFTQYDASLASAFAVRCMKN